ncbi:MAG: DNA polymerase III subunit alpha [Nitrospirae bacterium]|nr:DNA polymerase III subunit alpha [Nitrospirota bacterium]
MHHAPFVHLRCHTEYSLLKCTNRIDALVAKAAEYRLPALALTDMGNLFGAVQFYQTAVAAGIKPILGAQVNVAPDSRCIRPGGAPEDTPEMLLLCRDARGWRNLMELLSAAHLESMHDHTPLVDRELLERHADGLICLTGALNGVIPRLLEGGHPTAAQDTLAWLKAAYGADNVFVELADNGMAGRRGLNLDLINLAHATHTPLVATADCFYLTPDDARAHDALLCIGSGAMMDETDRRRLPAGQFHFRAPDEMAAAFADLPDALENTVRIAQRCNLDLRFDTPYMPAFPVPGGMPPERYLEEQVFAGLARRFTEQGIPEEARPTYTERARWELDTINKMGYPGYFLIVWDIIRHAREQGIPVGPGRGSAAGSLVAYALRITDLDPLPYNLLFERFLNPERVSLPDIDMDFCMDHRDRVIHYVADKYGSDHVCQIITFGTMGAKAVLRDVARVLDFSFSESDRIAKLVPNTLGMTLDKAMQEEPRLKELVRSDARVGELMDIALALEGVARHASTHAAGVIISEDVLTRFTPLYRGPNNEVISHFAKDDAEAAGLVKFDFLGLKTLTVIDHAVKEVRRAGGNLDLDAVTHTGITRNDPKTYELLCRGDTTGVFQLESSGMKDLIVKMQPGTFEDLVALLALYRPGPIGSGMLDDFINRKKGTTPITYDLPELEPILKETYGVIVYQEQVMRIANVVAGYSLGDADLLRRAMGKKKASEMEKQKARFIVGATAKGHDPKVAERIFDLMAYFAGYGFNKSHSAAYAVVSFQTAYLKAHHPVEFMAALLTNDMTNPDKTAKNIAEVREMKIPLLPPDINHSGIRFTCEAAPPDSQRYPLGGTSIDRRERSECKADGAQDPRHVQWMGEGPSTAQRSNRGAQQVDRGHLGIRYGLGGIKGVGEAALESVVAQRTRAPYTGLADLCQRIDLNKSNKRVLEALIHAGALDAFGPRAALSAALPEAMEAGSRGARERESGQFSIFGAEAAAVPEPNLTRTPEWDDHERLTREKEALGFYLSSHPMRRYREDARRFATTTVESLAQCADGKEVRLAGILTGVRGRITKKGDRMAFLALEDEHGQTEVIAFPDAFKQAEPLLRVDAPLLVTGTVDASDTGTNKIKATRIDNLIDIRKQRVRQVILHFTSTGLSRADMAGLRAALTRHPGPCAVRLEVHMPGVADVTLSTAPDLQVAADDALISDVERVLGRGTVAFA